MAVDGEHGADSSMFFNIAGEHMRNSQSRSKGRSKSIILTWDSLWTLIVTETHALESEYFRD